MAKTQNPAAETAAQSSPGATNTPETSVPAPELENAATGGVEHDAANTEDYPVEILLQVVHPNGIYMRLGPGKGFEPVQTLPRGTMITRMPVPEYAEVPGWLCVSLEGPHGQPIYGWVDATLVEEI